MIDFDTEQAVLCKGKKVLDIGCLGNIEESLCVQFLEHCKLAEVCIGIDNNKLLHRKAKRLDLNNIVLVDIAREKEVRKFLLRYGSFDVILATEIIEHIADLAGFLRNVGLLLEKTGRLIVTTPNCFSLRWYKHLLKKNLSTIVNPEHVCWFDSITLRALFTQAGYKVYRLSAFGEPTKEEMLLFGVTKTEEWMKKRLFLVAGKG